MFERETITIRVEPGDCGLFHATSPQMAELFVTGETQIQALTLASEYIEWRDRQISGISDAAASDGPSLLSQPD